MRVHGGAAAARFKRADAMLGLYMAALGFQGCKLFRRTDARLAGPTRSGESTAGTRGSSVARALTR